MALDYRKMKFEDIYNWCEENGQLDWLEAKVKEEVEVEVYPFITVDGKRQQDKSAQPTIEKRTLSYLQVKDAFVTKFMSDIKPTKKPGAKTMLDWFK